MSYFFPSCFCLDPNFVPVSYTLITRFRSSCDSKYIPQRRSKAFGSGDSIGLLTQNRFINIKRQNSLSSLIAKRYKITISHKSIFIRSQVSTLIRKSQFSFCVECFVQAIILIMQMFLKVKLVKLSFLIPIADPSFSSESVQNGIIVHQLYLQYQEILINIRGSWIVLDKVQGSKQILKKPSAYRQTLQTPGILQQLNFYETNYHQPSLVRKIFFSSSLTSCEKSLMATAEHFLFLVTFLFLSYLQMPKYSPKVSPSSISMTGTLFLPARPFTSLTQLASVQFLARMTYLALSFSSLFSRALQTSWSPLARRESELQVWMILLRAVSQSATWVSAIDSDGNKYYIKYLIKLPILKLIYLISQQPVSFSTIKTANQEFERKSLYQKCEARDFQENALKTLEFETFFHRFRLNFKTSSIFFENAYFVLSVIYHQVDSKPHQIFYNNSTPNNIYMSINTKVIHRFLREPNLSSSIYKRVANRSDPFNNTLTVLKDPKTNRELYLIGTTNSSTTLAYRTKKLVEQLKPSSVYVQATSGWWNYAKHVQVGNQDTFREVSWGFPEDEYTHYNNFRGILWRVRYYLWMATMKVFTNFPADFTPFTPGLETKFALEVAAKNNAKIHFGGEEFDPVTIEALRTETRMYPHTFLWKSRLFLRSQNAYNSEFNDFTKTLRVRGGEAFAESIDRSRANLMVAFLSKIAPEQKKILVDMRDETIFRDLYTKCEGNKIVAVVNQWHMEGIETHWRRATGTEQKVEQLSPVADMDIDEYQERHVINEFLREYTSKVTKSEPASSQDMGTTYHKENYEYERTRHTHHNSHADIDPPGTTSKKSHHH